MRYGKNNMKVKQSKKIKCKEILLKQFVLLVIGDCIAIAGYNIDNSNRKRKREDKSPFSRKSKTTARTLERILKSTDMDKLKTIRTQLRAQVQINEKGK